MRHAPPRRRRVAALAPCALGSFILLLAAPALAQRRTTLTRTERPLSSLPFDSKAAGSIVVSPDGTRGAYVKPLKGNEEGAVVVVVDGNTLGLPYDQVGRNVVTFSADSRHVAFAGRRGGQWYAVVDGAEGEPFDLVAGETLTFSPDGSRTAYVAGSGGKALVVTDGAAGKSYDGIVDGTLSFSPDGQRLAYVARSGGREVLVLNDAETKSYDAVSRPRFSRDGQHLAYAASLAGRSLVVLDGNEARAYEAGDPVHALSLTFSPDGQRLAYVVGPPGKTRAVADGAEGKPYEQVFDDSIAFSPDGKRVAYMAVRPGRNSRENAVVVVDGNEGRPHAGVVPGSVRFSADGRRVAYLAERAGADGVVRRCAVVDGAEGKPYDWVRDAPVFSPDGRHFAYVAERRTTTAAVAARLPPPQRQVAERDVVLQAQTGRDVPLFESFAVVDGTEAAPYPWVRGDLLFTPDGGRLAYVASQPDARFLDAGEVPAQPGNPAAGGRLVFERARAAGYIPGRDAEPVKLLVVEEQIGAE